MWQLVGLNYFMVKYGFGPYILRDFEEWSLLFKGF